MALNLNFTFDDNTYRHYLNGELMVLHCHHYMALYTKLAEDMSDYGGPKILKESVEDAFLGFINQVVSDSSLSDPASRLAGGAELYSVLGLGTMEVSGSEAGGEVSLVRSHVDEGWKKKWGNNHKFINHFTCGYVAAMFSAAYGKGARTYDVNEVASIAMGEAKGRITVKQK